MGKKIIITGGLGYIGTELCKIYSGYSWNDEIIVIDKRFISERVTQLRNWNINFVQGDILNKELIKYYCADADIIHHLAGITKVPRVKSESNDQEDKEIKQVAEQGTQNILDVISNNCKIILPSTHVVFEGMKNIKKDILEDEVTAPLLSYAKSKDYNEKQLKKSGKNYVILRLGTIFGTSIGMRFHTAINKFCWQANFNKPITVWETALEQRRPYLGINDAVTAIALIINNNLFNRETYDVVTQNLSVNDVIKVLKSFSENIDINFVQSKIMNEYSFGVSSIKIEKVGMKFKDSLYEQISKTLELLENSNI